MTPRSRLPALALALAACALPIAKTDRAAAQTATSPPFAVSAPATGEPMVLLPPSAASAEPKRRGGFGGFSPFRRPVPPPPSMDAIHKPTVTPPPPPAQLAPSESELTAPAQAASRPDTPNATPTVAATPDAPVPLPRPHPGRQQSIVTTLVASAERPADPISDPMNPNLSAELMNERALDRAAAAASAVANGSDLASGAKIPVEPQTAPATAIAASGLPIPRPRPGSRPTDHSAGRAEVAAAQPDTASTEPGGHDAVSGDHFDASVDPHGTKMARAVSTDARQMAEPTLQTGDGQPANTAPTSHQTPPADARTATDDHTPTPTHAPARPATDERVANQATAFADDDPLAVNVDAIPDMTADAHAATDEETSASTEVTEEVVAIAHGTDGEENSIDTATDGGDSASEAGSEHEAATGGHDAEEPAAKPLDLPSRLGGPDLATQGAAIAPPYQLVRTLQTLQDNIAAGSSAALAAQKVLLARLDRDLLAADPALWQEPRNAEALVVYTLSGGRPEVTRELLSRDPIPNVDERLLRGALAYVEGRESEARKLLGEQDLLSLPTNMAGQVALAQATLTLASDANKSLELLDMARLLSPGTLVEEAALRREIYLVSEQNDVDKFERLARQYLRRFRHSVYAGNFRQRFAAALTRMSFVDDPTQFQRLDDLLSDIDDDSRRELYLVVARAAVNGGKTAVAAMAAEKALQSAGPASRDRARALLYRGAALAVTPDGLMPSLDDLRAVNRRLLPPSDAALYDAAAATADLILTAPEATSFDESDAAETSEAMIESAVLAQATSAVEAVDILLSETE